MYPLSRCKDPTSSSIIKSDFHIPIHVWQTRNRETIHQNPIKDSTINGKIRIQENFVSYLAYRGARNAASSLDQSQQ